MTAFLYELPHHKLLMKGCYIMKISLKKGLTLALIVATAAFITGCGGANSPRGGGVKAGPSPLGGAGRPKISGAGRDAR